jgi:hypothetical protein
MRTVNVDGTTTEGGEASWKLFGTFYTPFPKVTREFRSLIVVSDEEAGTHSIHIEITTSLYIDESGQERVDVPQSFTYEVGKANEGKGTHGFQFREIRCYYDMALIKNAKAKLEK